MEHYLTEIEGIAGRTGGDPLDALRKRAAARFAELGFPTTKQEDWRFTNVAPLAKSAFATGAPSTNGVAAADAAALGFGASLVFVDGRHRADLSAKTPHLQSLATVLRDDPGFVAEHVRADGGDQAFVALNAALVEDGYVLRVPAGEEVPGTVHVLFVSTDKGCHPRNAIVVGDGARVRLVETHVSLGDAAHWTNAVTEVRVGKNAQVDHTQLQFTNDAAYVTTSLQVHQARDSRYASHAVTLGGALVRNDIRASLDDENIHCTMNGLYLTRGTQHVDNHTWLEHRKPHCESHELYKGILEDKSSAVFAGRIHVFEDAQKTDAFQASRSLLLSDEATVDNLPQLEIYADDVKCSHGSTTGQLDDDALFYLRARGIPKEQARNMLIHAFAADVTDRIPDEAVRTRVLERFRARLPGGA